LFFEKDEFQLITAGSVARRQQFKVARACDQRAAALQSSITVLFQRGNERPKGRMNATQKGKKCRKHHKLGAFRAWPISGIIGRGSFQLQMMLFVRRRFVETKERRPIKNETLHSGST
jgi:hypothetical protein